MLSPPASSTRPGHGRRSAALEEIDPASAAAQVLGRRGTAAAAAGEEAVVAQRGRRLILRGVEPPVPPWHASMPPFEGGFGHFEARARARFSARAPQPSVIAAPKGTRPGRSHQGVGRSTCGGKRSVSAGPEEGQGGPVDRSTPGPEAGAQLGTQPQQQQRAGSRARPGPSRGEYGARGYGCRGFPGGFRRRCRRRWSGTTWPEGPDQRRTHYSAAATGGTTAPGSRAALAAAAAAAGRARPGASRCRSSRGRSSRSSTSAITRAPRATAVGSERVRRQLLGTPCSSLRCSPGSGPKERRRRARGSGVPGAVGKVGAAGRLGTRGDEGPRRAPASTVRDGRQGASARASAAGRNGAATCCQRFWCTCASSCRTALSTEL